MRILNVTQSYVPFQEFGGPPVKVRALSEGLAQRGHSVTVLTADWGLEERAKSQPELSNVERSPFGWRREEKGVQAIYLPTWLRYRAMSWNPAVRRYCRARLQNFDVVHIFGLYDLLGPAVASACRTQGIPYVVEPIGMFLPIVRNILLKRMYHLFLGRKMLKSASALVATSEQEAEELIAGGMARDKTVLRRNGVEAPHSWPARDTFRTAHGISSEVKLVLFLGRLSSKKSPELLLQSFAELPPRIGGIQVEVVFAGPDEGGLQARLKQTAAHLGVSSRVHFTGPVFGDAKWAAYRDADVFVLPSQNENFGNTAAEAIAAGTPVIVSERCGIAPLLADVAGLVVPHAANALRCALERVLGEAELHAQLSAGCEKATAQLGWNEPVKEMEDLYARMAARETSVTKSQPLE
jgi:glycosyltransferase involved in cell wall biosynthesis